MHRVAQKHTNDLLLAGATLLISLVLTGCSAFAPAKPANAQTPQPAPVNQSAKVSRALAADVVPTDLDAQSGTTDVVAITDPANFASSARQIATRETATDAADALDRPSVVHYAVYFRHSVTPTANEETSTDAPDELDQPSSVPAFADAVYFRHADPIEETPSTSGGTGLTISAPDEQDLSTSVADAIPTRKPNPVEGTASPSDYTDLWDRIRSGLRVPRLDHQRVAYHERWFSKHPEYMKRKMKRASLFLYHIVEEIDRRGLPMDLALLPAIESAYQPHAYSHARASGLWQFIAPTARRYGLKVNWWYDGRRDVVASTTAALNYLEDLYAEFDDWYLALAAYNAGEGKIRYLRELNRRRGLPTGYVHLRRLKSETQHYVPKLMAMINIVSNPEKYGITLEPIPNEPYFGRVELGSQIDLNVVAKLADVPVGDLYDINPGFRRWATDPTGPHQVLVPIANKDTLHAGLASLSKDARIKWQRHRVKRGDTLGVIGKRYGVNVSAIKKANNIRGTLIHVDQNLMIPISSRPLSRNIANITRPLPRSSVGPRGRAKIIHRVRQGETLWSIARKYRVYVRQLARWNRMRTRDILRVGTRLKIWIRPTQFSSIDSASSG